MAPMRRLALLSLLLAACGDDDPAPSPPPPPPPPAIVDWVYTQVPGWDLEIHVPKAWSGSQQFLMEGREVSFGGPLDDGWKPELYFGWIARDQTLDEWGGRKIRAFEESPNEQVLARGTTVVAGMAALYCVYGYERKAADSGPQQMRGLVFYFVGYGHIGYVRGVCTARTSGRYFPAFEEAARRVRYVPG